MRFLALALALILSRATVAQTIIQNNAALHALPSTFASVVKRLGYATLGDSPSVTYFPATTCPYSGTQPDGGACIATSDGKYWVAQFADNVADLSVWGAKCDGVTDDAAAIQAAANWVAPHYSLHVPGVCVFKTFISFPNVGYVTIEGNGKNSELQYNGTATAGNAITIGSSANGSCVTGWSLRNFRVMSATDMISGDALLLGHLCASNIANVDVGNDGNQNWYNGIHISGGSDINVQGGSFSSGNIAEIVNGDATTPFNRLYQIQTKVSQSLTGINVAGNVGSFTLDQSSVTLNGTNVQIDQSQVAIANKQEFFGPGVVIDGTAPGVGAGVGVNVADPGGASSAIFFTGTWLASAKSPAAVCLYIRSTVANLNVNYVGGSVTGCTSDGVRIDSTSANVLFSGTFIGSNTGYGVNLTTTNANVVLNNIIWGTNNSGSGNHSGNYTNNVVNAFSVGSGYLQSGGTVQISAVGNAQLSSGSSSYTILCAGSTASQYGLWFSNTMAVPGKCDGSARVSGNFSFGSSTYPIDGAYFNYYYTGGTAGVSCAAGSVSLTTFTVINGIVTHC